MSATTDTAANPAALRELRLLTEAFALWRRLAWLAEIAGEGTHLGGFYGAIAARARRRYRRRCLHIRAVPMAWGTRVAG